MAAAAAASAAAAAAAVVALAAALVERRVGLSPTAGSVAASEGGGIFSHGGRVNSMATMEVLVMD